MNIFLFSIVVSSLTLTIGISSGLTCYSCDSRSTRGQCYRKVSDAKTLLSRDCPASSLYCLTVTGNVTRRPDTNRTIASYIVRDCGPGGQALTHPATTYCVDGLHDGLTSRNCYCSASYCNGDVVAVAHLSTTFPSASAAGEAVKAPSPTSSSSKSELKMSCNSAAMTLILINLICVYRCTYTEHA